MSQVVLAGLSGIALQYFRVAWGTIAVGMVMHGLFDVTRFLSADYGATRSTRVALPIQLLTSAGVRHLLLPGRS